MRTRVFSALFTDAPPPTPNPWITLLWGHIYPVPAVCMCQALSGYWNIMVNMPDEVSALKELRTVVLQT